MQCSVWVQTRQSMIQYPQTGCHQTFRLTQEESQTWWQKANRTRDGHGCNIFIPKLGQDTSPCAAQGNKERYVLKPPQVVRVGSKKAAHGGWSYENRVENKHMMDVHPPSMVKS